MPYWGVWMLPWGNKHLRSILQRWITWSGWQCKKINFHPGGESGTGGQSLHKVRRVAPQRRGLAWVSHISQCVEGSWGEESKQCQSEEGTHQGSAQSRESEHTEGKGKVDCMVCDTPWAAWNGIYVGLGWHGEAESKWGEAGVYIWG